MYAPINHLLADELQAERSALAGHRDRFVSAPAKAESAEPALAIRLSRPHDARALERLGRLDADGRTARRLASLADGGALIADVDGEVVAAVSLDGEQHVADPFRPTAEVSALLRLRASQLFAPREPHRLPALGMLRTRAHS